MKKEYNIKQLNPRDNFYAKRLKKQITIKLDSLTIQYFKELSKDNGIPYQTLINMYLNDCANKKRKLQMNWE